ncbi:MAG TPA: hypothetical protein PKH77_05420 [Anaerolineae bacterium]|nr:hypothetical protein [Anaerolineae bacterium]
MTLDVTTKLIPVLEVEARTQAVANRVRWRAGLLGRTGANDDGRIFALLDAARVKWG